MGHASEDQPLPWKISADRITHQQDPEAVIAEGDVFLQQFRGEKPSGLEIEADRIRYNLFDNSVQATGNLHLVDRNNEVRASEAQIELESQTGIFKDASIFWRENNLTVSADLIERTAREVFHFKGGRFTACPTGADRAPDWSIWGRDVKIILDNYARLKHVTLRVKDIPVFYLPYLRFPVGSNKKSGFLFPEYSSSERNGAGLIAPVFINLSPSYDITLYPGYYTERGPVLAGEFRYTAGPDSRGTIRANYLRDDLEDTPAEEFKSDGLLRTNSGRYWVRGKADHNFGNRLVAKLDIDLVSDRDYLQEFRKGIIGFDQSDEEFFDLYKRGLQAETEDQRESTLQVSKIWTSTDLQAEINIIDDVRDGADEVTPPWALPRIAYSGLLPFFKTPLDLVWSTEYVNFWRDEGLRTQRVDIFPQFNGPLTFSRFFESSYLLGVRDTLYFIENPEAASSGIFAAEDFEHRTMYNVLLTGASTLSRDYGLSSEKFRSLRHSIRPEISYLLEQNVRQEVLPAFDEKDSITEKNWVQYGLNNYFRRIRFDEVSLFRSNYNLLKVNQVYDADAGEHHFSDLNLELLIREFEDLSFRYETTLSMYGEGVTTYSLEAGYSNERGDRLNIDYHYKRNPDIAPPYFYSDSAGNSLSELRSNLKARLSELFSVRFDLTYSLSSDNTVNSTFGLIYHNPCWNLEFAANRTPDDTGFYLLFSLAGISTPLDFELPEF